MPDRSVRIFSIILAFILAWVTTNFIENKIREKYSKHICLFLIIFICLIAFLGFAINIAKGIKTRPISIKYESNLSSIKEPINSKICHEIPYAYKIKNNWFCKIGDKKPDFFIYGDSHSLNLLPALKILNTKEKVSFVMTGASGCPPLLGIQSVRKRADIEKFNCLKLNERVFEYVKDNSIHNVILSSRWVYYMDNISRPSEWNPVSRNMANEINKATSEKDLKWAFINTINKYNSIGVKVYIVEDTPQQKIDPLDALRKTRFLNDVSINKLSISKGEHLMNQGLINNFIESQKVFILNFDNILCPNNFCPLVENGNFLYFDDDHLSNFGGERIYPEISKLLKKY